MVDRANFRRLNPNYGMPQIKRESQNIVPQIVQPVEIMPPNIGPIPSSVTQAIPPPMPAMVSVAHPRRGRPARTYNGTAVTLMNAESDKLKPVEEELSDEELMLASPVLYGFSLSDKIWCKHRYPHPFLT